MALLFLISGFLFYHMSSAVPDFGYDGLHGPQHWGDDYNGCVGKHQSPINIVDHVVKNVSLPIVQFSGLEPSRETYLENNGHTVMLRMNNSETATVFGGSLGSEPYAFEQLHFHWGENDHEGSEDLINNHSFAMELHAVFYKKIYGSFAQAVHHPDGLAVLAYFFEASEEDNPTYDAIVSALPEIEGVGATVKLLDPLILHPLLLPNPATLQDYFTYNGSLTTPPCFEVVTWIDFKEPLPLSHKQIAAFRNVRSPEGMRLTHNFRPIQPLEDRLVYHNVPGWTDQHNHHHHHSEASGQFNLQASFLPLAFGAVLLTTPPVIWTSVFDIFGAFR